MVSLTLENWNKRHNHKLLYCTGLFSALWICCVLLLIYIFAKNGKTFVWDYDGFWQHFSSYNYLCDYLGEIFKTGKLPPFFDFSLGQGLDKLTTLDSYDFTDPVCIVTAIFTPLTRLQRYTLMIFIKLFLIGFSFIVFCWSTERKESDKVAPAALAYTFSGAILFMFARHPNYINWAYFLPFLLSGVETYKKKKKKVPLIFFCFLNVVTSFYTFYMNAILVAIYCMVAFVINVLKDRSRLNLFREFRKLISIAAISAFGVALASIVFLPTIDAYLSNSRIASASGYTASLWVYNTDYYTKNFERLFFPFSAGGYNSYLGFNAILFIPLVLLLFSKSEKKNIKVLVIISFIMFCVPICGRIMNGMGYASNRWAYAIPFYLSIAFVDMFPHVQKLTQKEKIILFSILCIYIVLCFMCADSNTDLRKAVTLTVLAGTVILFGLFNHYLPGKLTVLFVIISLVSCLCHVQLTFGEKGGGYVKEFRSQEEMSSIEDDYSSYASLDLSNDFYRFAADENQPNIGGYNKSFGVSTFWSMLPATMTQYYQRLGINDTWTNCDYRGLGKRSGLMEIASVKYYTRPKTSSNQIPYGYNKLIETDRFEVFENEYALPIGYTYPGYITREQYDQLDVLSKEQSLLQGAVLEEPIKGYSQIEPIINMKRLEYNVLEKDGVNITDGHLSITKAAGSFSIVTDVPDHEELFLVLRGAELYENRRHVGITVTRNKDEYKATQKTRLSNQTYSWPVEHDEIAFDLGNSSGGQNTIKIRFGAIAEIDIDAIELICIPTEAYKEYMLNLRQYSLQNAEVNCDHITGTITVPNQRILQLSIPFSKGWKASIDGKETPILCSDVMYMAIPIAEGSHNIELNYNTPYLKEGFVISLISMFGWLVYEISRRMWKSRRNIGK